MGIRKQLKFLNRTLVCKKISTATSYKNYEVNSLRRRNTIKFNGNYQRLNKIGWVKCLYKLYKYMNNIYSAYGLKVGLRAKPRTMAYKKGPKRASQQAPSTEGIQKNLALIKFTAVPETNIDNVRGGEPITFTEVGQISMAPSRQQNRGNTFSPQRIKSEEKLTFY